MLLVIDETGSLSASVDPCAVVEEPVATVDDNVVEKLEELAAVEADVLGGNDVELVAPAVVFEESHEPNPD